MSSCSLDYCNSNYNNLTEIEKIEQQQQHVRALGFGFKQKYPAPLLEISNTKSYQTILTVNVELEFDGLVYCGAFRSLSDDAILKPSKQ